MNWTQLHILFHLQALTIVQVLPAALPWLTDLACQYVCSSEYSLIVKQNISGKCRFTIQNCSCKLFIKSFIPYPWTYLSTLQRRYGFLYEYYMLAMWWKKWSCPYYISLLFSIIHCKWSSEDRTFLQLWRFILWFRIQIVQE